MSRTERGQNRRSQGTRGTCASPCGLLVGSQEDFHVLVDVLHSSESFEEILTKLEDISQYYRSQLTFTATALITTSGKMLSDVTRVSICNQPCSINRVVAEKCAGREAVLNYLCAYRNVYFKVVRLQRGQQGRLAGKVKMAKNSSGSLV